MAIDPVVTSQNGLTNTERIPSDKGREVRRRVDPGTDGRGSL